MTKTILIAIPTNKYVESETFKSIYDLDIPEGYVTEFQCFYGYRVDQIRNLIAEWAKRYDYLFAVDSDIILPRDTLSKMLALDLDVVSGLYIQRKPGQHILELYREGRNIPIEDIQGRGVVEVDGCGFGGVLIKSEVFRKMQYPHFFYTSALDHANTISEDVYFCNKARALGFRIWADTSIHFGHVGSNTFEVSEIKGLVREDPPAPVKKIDLDAPKPQAIVTERVGVDRLFELSEQPLLPKPHIDYLLDMRTKYPDPKIVYDIGACVLHWTKVAKQVWPGANIIAFEAMEESRALFESYKIPHFIGVLSDEDNKHVSFYKNVEHPGGNSYYLENEKMNSEAPLYFNEKHKTEATTITLDTVIKISKVPYPDLIKIDVQGAELDVLKGATKCLENCSHLILELQRVEYNTGAPLREEVIKWLAERGWTLESGPEPFSNNGLDGDYHFTRAK